MYPGLLSTLLPSKQKMPAVNHRYDYRHPFEQQERRMAGLAAASHQQAHQLCGGIQQSGREMRFYPEIYVKMTTSDSYLQNSKAKPRLKWEHELQERFVQSVDALGGEEYATPKKILYMMNAIGLTLSHLKSHLQKYRIAIRAPPRRPQINRKKKARSATASLGVLGSSSSIKKSGANEWKAGSSKAGKRYGNKPLKIQDGEMAMEVANKTRGNQAVVAHSSASRRGKEPATRVPSCASRKEDEPSSKTMGNWINRGDSSVVNIAAASALASSKGKEPATLTMSDQILRASPSDSSKGKKPVSQNMGINASTFSSRKVMPSLDFETKSYPVQQSLFDIQLEKYWQEVLVRGSNVARASEKEQFAFCQSLRQSLSFSRNLDYLNQYSAPDSNSSGHAGGSKNIFANYLMNSSTSSSAIFEKSMEPAGLPFSSSEKTIVTDSSFSSVLENSINSGSSFPSAYGNVNTGSRVVSDLKRCLSSVRCLSSSMLATSEFPSMIQNPMGPCSNLSQMIANPRVPGPAFSSMDENLIGLNSSFSPVIENSTEFRSGFPSMMANPTGPSSSLTMTGTNPMGISSGFPSMNANPPRLGSNFYQMFGNPAGPTSSFSPVTATPNEQGSSFHLMISNPMESTSSFPSMVTSPKETSAANPMESGLDHLSRPVNPGSSFLSLLTDQTDPDFYSMFVDPGSSYFPMADQKPSGSSFSSMFESLTDPEWYFSSTSEGSAADSDSSVSSTSDGSMDTSLGSSVVNSMDSDETSDYIQDDMNGTSTGDVSAASSNVSHGIAGIFP